MKNCQKLRIFKTSLKKPMKPIFFENFFRRKCSLGSCAILAKTWCPYRFWILRNLPHKFEKLAHVTKSAKKNVTIWASRKARAPNTPRAPFIFPCYHCQVVQYKIPLKYRPLQTLTLSPASPLLQLHFKLEDLHFEHHPTSSSTFWTQKTDIQQLASLSFNRKSFFQLLN